MRSLLIALGALLLIPVSASALPVSISVDPWKSVDGNFGYSLVHSASAGRMTMGGLDFYAGGSIQYEFVGPTNVLSGDLTGSVLSINASSLMLGGAQFNVQNSVLDFGVANGAMIGSIGYELVDAGISEVGSFYFYKMNFTNGACNANGLCADGQYRLWGNNWDNGLGNPPKGNVVVDGVLTTAQRGIDLGGGIAAAVPEPSAAILFGFGALIVGRGARRHQNPE